MNKYLVFLLTLVAACSGVTQTESVHYWLDSTVIQKLNRSTDEIGLARPPLEFVDGTKVTSCNGYFQKSNKIVESTANYSAQSHYLICDALKVAETWPVPADGLRSDPDLSLCSKLSLGGFKHSLRPRMKAENSTLSQLFGTGVIQGASSCTFQGEGRNFALNAILLVSDSQKPQRLWVWVIDEILDASYRSYSPHWFVFDKSKDMWIAQ